MHIHIHQALNGHNSPRCTVAECSCSTSGKQPTDTSCACPLYPPAADVECGDPGQPSNGNSSFSSTVEGSSVFHSCQSGYNLVGDRRRVCRGDGRWSGSLPECRGEGLDQVAPSEQLSSSAHCFNEHFDILYQCESVKLELAGKTFGETNFFDSFILNHSLMQPS